VTCGAHVGSPSRNPRWRRERGKCYHKTSGQGQDLNEGYDAFVPLIDSGIYIAAWVKPRFLSTIVYTCGEFDEDRAVTIVRDFFKLAEHQAAIF